MRSRIRFDVPPAPVVFHPCHRHRFLFLSISKNGCTSVKQAILAADGEPGSANTTRIHEALGFRHNGRTCLAPYAVCGSEFDDYTRFAVWRSPASRFRSLRGWLNGADGRKRFRWLTLRDTIESFDAKTLLALVEAELEASHIDAVDEHVRLQYHTLQAAPDLDYIVPMELLDAFMKEKFGLAIDRRNESGQAAGEAARERIPAALARLTAPDAMIPTWFSDRFYRPDWTAADLAARAAPHSVCVVLILQCREQVDDLDTLELWTVANTAIVLAASEDGRLPTRSIEIDRVTIGGRLVAGDNFERALHEAVTLAWQRSEFVLVVYGDERASAGGGTDEAIDAPIHAVEVAVPDGSSRLVSRLFRRGSAIAALRSGTPCPASGESAALFGVRLAKLPHRSPPLALARDDIARVRAGAVIAAADRDLVLAELLASLGRHEEAIAAFSACDLDTMHPSTASFVALRKAEQMRSAGRSVAEVLEVYHRSWGFQKSKIEPLYHIATLLRAAGQVDAALAAARRATNAPLRDVAVYFDRSIYEYPARHEYGHSAR
ncbi:MAG: hypothetical protein DWQ08_05540, partial [Proteobacteria bacterium]